MPRIENPGELTNPKIKGKVIAKIHGLTIYAELRLPKRLGKLACKSRFAKSRDAIGTWNKV